MSTPGQDHGGRTVVIGVGNEFRRDDGVGPAVVARLRELQPGDARLAGVILALSDGEPTRMIDLWTGADLAVVIDAVRDCGVPAGHRYELAVDALVVDALPGAVHRAASSHAIDLGETVELARALGRLPARLVVLAIAGQDFGFGTGLTDGVASTVEPLVERVREAVG
jgi:hydrogenase maturation protease